MIPAALSLLPKQTSPAFSRPSGSPKTGDADWFARLMAAVVGVVSRWPRTVVFLAATIACAGLYAAFGLEADDARIESFQHHEPIYLADTAINSHLDGGNFIDILVETPMAEGLFDPERLKKIERLQRFLESLDHVGGTESIVDYLKQMNRVVNEGRAETYVLPDDPDLIAQYFLLYSLTGSPSDFSHLVDYEYRRANIRARLKSGQYSDERPVVTATEQYLEDNFESADLKARLTGRVVIDYFWMRDLISAHFRGVAIALITVLIVAAVSFGSLVAGILAVLPVATSVLLVYAVMVVTGMKLSVSTSMISAISIGIGVDFATHTVDRLRYLVRDKGHSIEEALARLSTSTGRALLFNFLAVFFGFGVIVVSNVPGLTQFGTLVAVAVSASFLSSMTLIPALVRVLRPSFLGRPGPRGKPRNPVSTQTAEG
jgi:predicted RND superfamily exporter protein